MRRMLLGLLTVLGFAATSQAGPIILDGTDSDDHGSGNNVVNNAGWKYIQKSLENLIPQVGGVNSHQVVVIGASSVALSAYTSASTVAGITVGPISTTVITGAQITTFLTGGTVSGRNLGNTGLLYIPSDGVSGGISIADQGQLTANAAAINTFVAGGGGLFSMGHQYGWLSTLLPGIVVTPGGSSAALSLTMDGTNAFPGLSNGDLSTGPWHYDFSGNLGGLNVLFTSNVGGARPTRNVGLGGGSGTNIVSTVPEPATLAVFGGIALAGAFGYRRRKATASV